MQLAKWCFPLTSVKSDSGDAGRIHQLSIRITDLCNLRCHTCGQWGDNGFLHGVDLHELRNRELSVQRYGELFHDLVAHNHKPNVYIWGGEPTMYRGLQEVIRQATRLALPTSIATNGHRLTDFADFFVREPLFLLQVSIDGPSPEIHNAARPAAGNRESFHEIRQGLAEVKKAKSVRGGRLPVVASLTVVSQKNIKYLVDIYETFRDHVDVFVFYLSWWIDEENAALHETDFARRFNFRPRLHRGWMGNWRPVDFLFLSSQLTKLQSFGKTHGPAVTIIPNLSNPHDLQRYYTEHRDTFGYDQCISIYQAVELDSNGDMSPCRDYHDYVVGNVAEQTITELWNSPIYKKFRTSLRNSGLMPVCTRCCGLMGY